MGMDEKTIEFIGGKLFAAQQSRRPIKTMSKEYDGFSIEDAYKTQQCLIRHHLESGYTPSGKKIGLTSKAMRDLVHINEPDYGIIFHQNAVSNEGEISADQCIIPRVEAELVFKLKKDINKKNVCVQDIINATDYIVAAFEIIDNRYDIDGQTIADSIADNAAFCAYVLGDIPISPEKLDLRHLGFILEKNGRQVSTGSGAAIMGNPFNAMVWLANRMVELENPLKAGELVLSGSMIAAVDAAKGDYFRGRFGPFEDVGVHFI